jgi:osmotically-inducible protein OsmY
MAAFAGLSQQHVRIEAGPWHIICPMTRWGGAARNWAADGDMWILASSEIGVRGSDMGIPATEFATEFAAVDKFRFGAPVHSDDGELGALEYIAVDAARQTVTAIGVKFGFFGQRCLVPIAQVAEATPENIRLRLTRAEVERSKDQPAGPVLQSGTAVALNGKRIGRLVQLTSDHQTRVLRHLVVDRIGGEVLAPARTITKIDSRQVELSIPNFTVAQLTPYRPDDELHEEIRLAIEDVPRLRVDLPGMDIRVIDGVVWLRGHCASDLSRRLTFERVEGIRGIAELHNELLSDQALAAAVSSALADDPRTVRERVGVYPRLGHVFLRGRASSEAARVAAGEIARAVPGIIDLHNELIVDPLVSEIPDLAGVTNNEDLVPGGR